MCPSLSTKIWSAPTTVESLQGKADVTLTWGERLPEGLHGVRRFNPRASHLLSRGQVCVPLWGGLASTSQMSPFPLSLPVCNNDGGAVGADLGQRSLDVSLSLCVKCRCGLEGETQHGEGIEVVWQLLVWGCYRAG